MEGLWNVLFFGHGLAVVEKFLVTLAQAWVLHVARYRGVESREHHIRYSYRPFNASGRQVTWTGVVFHVYIQKKNTQEEREWHPSGSRRPMGHSVPYL